MGLSNEEALAKALELWSRPRLSYDSEDRWSPYHISAPEEVHRSGKSWEECFGLPPPSPVPQREQRRHRRHHHRRV
jgi:hypothetical protein